MRKLTAERKREIYLEIAECLHDLGNCKYRFICGMMVWIHEGIPFRSHIHTEEYIFARFPELELFKPDTKPELQDSRGWFGGDIEARITACCFMAEMREP